MTQVNRAATTAKTLLAKPLAGWVWEDLSSSEWAKHTLVAGDGSLSLVSQLFARHQMEATLLLAPESVGHPISAERLLEVAR